MNISPLPRFGQVLDHGTDEDQARQYVKDLQGRNEPALILVLPPVRELPQDELRFLTVDNEDGADPEANRINHPWIRHWLVKWQSLEKDRHAREAQEKLWKQLAKIAGVEKGDRKTYDPDRLQFRWYGTHDDV